MNNRIPLKKNIFFSALSSVTGYVFPMLTFPYATRVLGVESFGLYSYVEGVMGFVLLFGMMGVSILGVRSIAQFKGNSNLLNKVFTSLFLLNLLSILISVSICVLYVLYIDVNGSNKLYLIGLSKVFFTFLSLDWFFRGMEDFKYVTLRTLAVRAMYVVSVFVFVRNEDHLDRFYALLAFSIFLSSLVSCIYARKFASFKFDFENLLSLVRPFCSLGFYMIITGFYTCFNIVYLGYKWGSEEVSFYSVSTKIVSIEIALYASLSTVILSRVSVLAVVESGSEEISRLLKKSFEFVFLISGIPILIVLLFADTVVRVVAGVGYENAIVPLKVSIFLILITGIEQVLITQYLMPLGKDKTVLRNSIWGASVALLGNFLLVGEFGSLGSVCVWLISELVVLLFTVVYIYKNTSVRIPFKSFLKNTIVFLVYYFTFFTIDSINDFTLVGDLFLISVLCVCLFFTFLYALKNEVLIDVMNLIRRA